MKKKLLVTSSILLGCFSLYLVSCNNSSNNSEVKKNLKQTQ